jgi:putative ABC transport system permease protein
VTQAINQQQIDTLFGNILIDPQPDQFYVDNVSQIEKTVSQNPDVAGVAPHLNDNAYFEYNWQDNVTGEKGQSGSWNVIGIDPQQEAEVTTVHDSLIAGQYLAPGDTGKILLGVEIAGGAQADSKPFLTLGRVNVGDYVRLTFSNGAQSQYQVKGIFKAGGGEVNNFAFISRTDMASVLGLNSGTDYASQILIRTQPGSNDNAVISQLKNLGINGQVRSWLDYGGGIGGIISSFGVVASLIGGIGLLVAGVVMFIVIYINVANRKRQIGILRAIGINRAVVLASYLVQAMLYAALGIIFGGLIFGYIIKPFFDSHPIDLPIGLVTVVINYRTIWMAVIGLLGAAVLAGIIPVTNITRHSIIKAIWGN